MLNKEEYKKKQIQQYYKNKYKEKLLINTYLSKRYDDVINKIIDNLSKRACKFFKKYNIDIKLTHMQLIGSSKEELQKHIEDKFTENMNYNNYGEWEIDHIKPISLCDTKNVEEIKEYFNYKNLQPLWKIDNIKKSNKICESNELSEANYL
jgi:hypothetical protein